MFTSQERVLKLAETEENLLDEMIAQNRQYEVEKKQRI